MRKPNGQIITSKVILKHFCCCHGRLIFLDTHLILCEGISIHFQNEKISYGKVVQTKSAGVKKKKKKKKIKEDNRTRCPQGSRERLFPFVRSPTFVQPINITSLALPNSHSSLHGPESLPASLHVRPDLGVLIPAFPHHLSDVTVTRQLVGVGAERDAVHWTLTNSFHDVCKHGLDKGHTD